MKTIDPDDPNTIIFEDNGDGWEPMNNGAIVFSENHGVDVSGEIRMDIADFFGNRITIIIEELEPE